MAGGRIGTRNGIKKASPLIENYNLLGVIIKEIDEKPV
jgi:hypothetical protein